MGKGLRCRNAGWFISVPASLLSVFLFSSQAIVSSKRPPFSRETPQKTKRKKRLDEPEL
jgi:hypothetical protein